MVTLYGSKHVAINTKNKVLLIVYTPLIIRKHKGMSNFKIKTVFLWGYRKNCCTSLTDAVLYLKVGWNIGLSVRLLGNNYIIARFEVDCVWNVMAHAQNPDFVFRRNGRVHLNRRGRQFSRLLAAEVCASAVVMLDTPCSEVVWRVLATHSIRQVAHQFPSRASPCAVTFQLQSTSRDVGEDWRRLECYTVSTGKQVRTFWRKTVPSASGSTFTHT